MLCTKPPGVIMDIRATIDPEMKEAGLLKGIDSINARIRSNASKLPQNLGKQAELHWSFRKYANGLIDPQLTTLRIQDEFVSLEDTFTTKGVINAVHHGEPDAAYWVFQLWTRYLDKRLENSRSRIDELMATVQE